MYLLYKPCEPGRPGQAISRVHNQSHNKFYFTPPVPGPVWPLGGGWGLVPRCAARAHVRREHQFASKAKDKEARSDLSVSRKHPLGGRQTAPAGDLTTARQPGGAGRGAAGLKAQGGSAGPKVPGSEPQVGAEVRPSSQKPLSDHRGLGRRRCQRRRWGTQAPCGRLRAKPALQTQRKEPLVFTQRSLLHSSPRWFSSRHSSMSAGGATGAASLSLQAAPHHRPLPCPTPKPRSPTQRAREASSWKPPGHSHTAPPGRGTQRPLTQRHSSESSSELSSSAWPRTILPSTLTPGQRLPTPPRPAPAALTSRGFPQQQGARVPEGIALAL